MPPAGSSRAPPAAQAQNPEKPNLTLAVGGKTLIAYLPLTIAERLGLFEKEGLNVEIADFAGGARALQSLVGGSADVVCGAYEHTIHMRAKGVGIKAVALQNYSLGTVIALSKEKAKSYRSPKDLAGLKIGVTSPGSASSLGMALLLAKDNLTLDNVSIIGVGTGATAVTAMKNRQIDGISNFDPAILILERDGAIVPIVDSRTLKGLDELYGGPMAGSSFYLREDFIAKNPRTVQAFTNAIVKAIRWLDKASVEDIVAAVPAEYYAGGGRDIYAEDDRAQPRPIHQGWPHRAGLGGNDLPGARRARRGAQERQGRSQGNVRQHVRRPGERGGAINSI